VSLSQTRLTLGAAILTITIVGIGMTLAIPLLSLRMVDAGYTAGVIGINSAVAGLTSIVCAPVVPLWARRFGTRRLLLAGLPAGALALIGFAATDNILVWLPLRFVFQVVLTTAFVLSEFWITAAAPEGRRGIVMGIYSTCLCAGFAAGPALLGLTGSAGMVPFAVGAALFLCATAPVAMAGSAAPAITGHASASAMTFVTLAPIATLAALLFGAVEAGGMALMPVYGLRNGHDYSEAAFLVSFFSLGNVAFQIPLGLLSDRVDRRKILLAVALMGCAGALAMPIVAHDFKRLALLLFVWGGVIGGCYPLGLAHLGSHFRGADLAGANAAFIMFYSLGMLVGPPYLGFAMDLAPQGLTLAMALVFGLYAMVVFRQLRAGPHEKPLP
jgi:MFS family permease